MSKENTFGPYSDPFRICLALKLNKRRYKMLYKPNMSVQTDCILNGPTFHVTKTMKHYRIHDLYGFSKDWSDSNYGVQL